MKLEIPQIISQIIGSIKSYVDEALNPLKKEISTLKGIVEDMPIYEKGLNGKDADPEVIKLMIGEAIELLPKAKDGKDADPIDMAEIKKLIDNAVSDAVEELAKQIPEPEKGLDGRDALDLEIIPEIVEGKAYPRGTFAIHKGGLWRSFQKTTGMHGWENVVNGISDISIEYDGERSIKVKTEKSSGDCIDKEFTIPVMIYKDIYKEGEKYTKGDTCTYAGSLYTCLNETQERPGTASKDWRLSTKRGRDGKDK